MSKARKYYGIFRMMQDIPNQHGYPPHLNVTAHHQGTIGTDRIVLEPAHETAFTKKKDAIAELSKAPYPSMLTIVEFYLILKK